MAANAAKALEIVRAYRTCELTTLSRDGSPQTWPVFALLLPDGRFLVGTSIGLPQKALNVRRNPKVSMLFSDATGSGVSQPGAVLIQGDAVSEDRIISDVTTEPDLVTLNEMLLARQPAGKFFISRLGRRLFPFYCLRILIHVTPRRALLWPTPDMVGDPEPIDLRELRRVG